MAEEKKVSKNDELMKWIGSYFLVVLGGLSLAIWWKKLPPELPWLYSLPWGEQQLIKKELMIGGMAGLGVATLFSNLVAQWIGKTDKGASKIVRRVSTILVVLFLLSWYKVLRLMLVL